ncbi:MAG TPA: preprotein translocase subunit YajC [Thermosynergistes sp.]|nr:preprotein translocase subunit YajC [Thermosynergistes sp.]HPZ76628.1 preprotein translocase subunit YajC [Thermosynergistes sp.]HQE21010.1 preprotein translocase subunit YajC [Thermosynergistes sp.]HXK88390.1 preprotein translocase subunit YajC [Thermosynergistes sp.]
MSNLQQQGLSSLLLPLLLFVLIFYFLIIRPQRRRQKQHEQMLASVNRGDQVVTIGGFFGTVKDVKDDSFILEIADGVRVRILKSAISARRSPAPASEPKEKEA